MRDLILLLFVVSVIPLALMRTHIGVLLWSWIGYMNPHRLTYGFTYFFPFAQLSAAVTLISLFISKEKKEFPLTSTTVIWLLFILWEAVTTPFAFYPEAAAYEWSRVWKIQLLMLITLLVFHDREKIQRLVWMLYLSIGFFGIKGGAFVLATGGSYKVWGPPLSFFEGNNEMALALVMVMPLGIYLYGQITHKWGKRAMLLSLVLMLFSIIGSYSRGALLAVSVVGFMFWLKSRRKAWSLVAVLVAIPVVYSFMPEQWFNRMETISTYEEDASVLGRFNSWYFAWNLSLEHFMGGGLGAFSKGQLYEQYAPDPEDYHDAHSIYFEILGEHGFLGLFLFLLLGLSALLSCSWVIKKTRDAPDLQWTNDLARMVQVSLLGFATGGAFLGLAHFDLFYHLIALAVLLKWHVNKQLLRSRE